MVTRAAFPADAAARIPVLLQTTADAAAYRRLVCVKLALDGRTGAQIAAVLGWNRNSVLRVWSRYRQEGEVALLGQPQGGRHHAYLTPVEEDTLLAPFLAPAEAGGVLVVAPIQAAYQARVGRVVPPSTIYRLLARHGWRKVAPRRRHPAQAEGVQEAFKKSSPSSSWMRSPRRRPLAPTADPSG